MRPLADIRRAYWDARARLTAEEHEAEQRLAPLRAECARLAAEYERAASADLSDIAA